jgi:hypothetical protein
MAKQTFTTGQVLLASQLTALQQTAMLGGSAQAKTASYVLVAADAGDAITMSNASPTTITVNTGLFAAGDIVTIINLGAGTCTITAGTATVATSGSLVLATNQGGVLRFTSTTAAIFFQFATPASGDIEGVTAGTGISGGGTSGTVTITNSMATEIAAKADLIVGTGAATFDNLTVGANGTVLTADSTVSPTGLKWAAPAGGSTYVGVSVQKTAQQSLSSGTFTLVSWDVENFDTDAFHDNSTNNSRITIPSGKGGKYLLSGGLRFTSGSAAGNRAATLYKNGTDINYIFFQPPTTTTNDNLQPFSFVVSLAAADYLQLYAYQNSGTTLNLDNLSYWQVSYLGA